MKENESDRNLLVGMLGLQLGLYTQQQLMAAMRKWSFQKSRTIEEVLQETGALIGKQNSFLRDMSQQYLQLHAGDVHQGVASLAVYPSVERELRGLDDEQVAQTLMIVQSRRQGTPASTKESMGETLSFVPTPATKDQRYRVLRPHASGGLGTVSVAEDRELHREVALKEMHTDRVQETELRNRFLLEAEVTGRLEHPGIVPVYSLGLNDAGNPYYVMRFIKGESLREAIGSLYRQKAELTRTEYRLAVRQLVQRLVDVCQAIEYAHSRGVLHRDLKPANVMLGKYGETLVVDWGLAKTGNPSDESQDSESEFIAASGDSDPHTQMGSLFGTLEYASPEQAEGRLDKMGPPSDVYSLGATLYSILTGQPAFAKEQLETMLQKVRTGDFSPPRQINPDVPRALEAICLKAMSLKPGDRYSSAAALAGDLELWLAGEPASAYAEPLWDRAMRWARRHRAAVATLSAILMMLMVGSIAFNVIIRSQNDALRILRNEALIQERKALDSLEDARSLAMYLLNTSEDHLSSSNIDGSAIWDLRLELTENSRDVFDKIYARYPSDPKVTNDYGKVLRISGNLKRFAGEFGVAEELLSKSLELQLGIPEQQRNLDTDLHLAETFRELATLFKAQGKLGAAQELISSSASLTEKWTPSENKSEILLRCKAQIDLEHIGLLEELELLEKAYEVALANAATFERLADGDDSIEMDNLCYLYSSARLIRLLAKLDRADEAEEVAVNAIPRGRRILKTSPEKSVFELPFARILAWSAQGLALGQEGSQQSGNLSRAMERADEAVQRLRQLTNEVSHPVYLSSLAESLRILAAIHRLDGEWIQAEETLDESIRLLGGLLEGSRNADHLHLMARALTEMALLKGLETDTHSAQELFERAEGLLAEAYSLRPESEELKTSLNKMQQTRPSR